MSGSLGEGPSDSTPIVVTTTTLLSAYDGPSPSGSLPLLCRLGLHRWVFRQRYDDESQDFVIYITESRCKRRCTRYPNWRLVDVEKTNVPSILSRRHGEELERSFLLGDAPERCPACEGHEGAYHVLSCEHRRDA